MANVNGHKSPPDRRVLMLRVGFSNYWLILRNSLKKDNQARLWGYYPNQKDEPTAVIYNSAVSNMEMPSLLSISFSLSAAEINQCSSEGVDITAMASAPVSFA